MCIDTVKKQKLKCSSRGVRASTEGLKNKAFPA